MHVSDLKKYIYKSGKIPFILEQLGCSNIKYHSNKGYFSCSNVDGDNKNAVNVFNDENLGCINYTRDIGHGADIFTLAQFYRKSCFKNTIQYIHDILGIENSWKANDKQTNVTKTKDPLNVFKKVFNRKIKQNVLEFEVLSESIFYDFVPHIHVNWFREGIIKKTIDRFSLAYSYKYKRTIVPLRYWCTGQLLGFNMRSSVDNCEEFDIPKYYITPNYPKNINLFGLWENYDEIIKAGYVVVMESEKSVLKRHSRNDGSCVALSGHVLSNEQVRILIGLNVDIIIALDNDICVQEVRHACEKFYGLRNVFYIQDKWDLLGKNDSPADADNRIYEFMFKYKTKYDAAEHKKYIENMRK